MNDSLPPNDLRSLEQHRQEARKYRKDIEDGTDPYFAHWWIGSMIVLIVGVIAVQAAVHYGWTGV